MTSFYVFGNQFRIVSICQTILHPFRSQSIKLNIIAPTIDQYGLSIMHGGEGDNLLPSPIPPRLPLPRYILCMFQCFDFHSEYLCRPNLPYSLLQFVKSGSALVNGQTCKRSYATYIKVHSLATINCGCIKTLSIYKTFSSFGTVRRLRFIDCKRPSYCMGASVSVRFSDLSPLTVLYDKCYLVLNLWANWELTQILTSLSHMVMLTQSLYQSGCGVLHPLESVERVFWGTIM